MNKQTGSKPNRYIIPLLILGVMFFVIGFGIGISGFLTPALRSAFDLSTGQAYLVTFAIFSAFVIFGRPSSWVIHKIGYRKSMVASFLIMAVGMLVFVPSATMVSFPLFLVALFIGGIGNTLLQASVNPYVTIIGPIESAARRMSMMGIMNKLAWWLAPLFLGIFIDLQEVRLDDVILPFYLVAGILTVLGIGIYFAPLPEVVAEGEEVLEEESEEDTSYSKNKTSILQFPHLLLGALALFIYVGIETLPMASVIDFAKVSFGDVPNLENYSIYVTAGLVMGYLVGVVAIPKYMNQTQAMIIFSVLGILSTFLLVLAPIGYAFYGLLLVSFSNALMWPAIWPLALKDLGRFTKVGSSILVMGIVGGAIIPLLFGNLVDLSQNITGLDTVKNYQNAYWIMMPCYAYLLYFALHGHKIRR
ncbi:MAG: glucose/galactose MFS transporter [Bacteroidales bacterium]